MGRVLNYFLFLVFVSLPLSVEAVAVGPASCDTEIKNVKKVSAAELVALARNTEGLVILDTRFDNDWKAGHIDEAVNISEERLSSGRLKQVARKSMPLVIYSDGTNNCKNSYNAVTKAYSWGWKSIYWLSGGLEEWSRAGYPLTRFQYFNWQE